MRRLRFVSFAVLAGLVASLVGATGASAVTFDNDAFRQRWDHTDLPVAEGLVDRTWVWGPAQITSGLDESYAESPDGARRVQYFDKSRMEITYPDGDTGDLWYVTNGLLVMEMVQGQVQVGDNTFQPAEPARANVAGDQTGDPASPTYATIGGLLDEDAKPVGEVLTERTDRAGTITLDETYANAGVTSAYHVPETDHSVASVFWDFMTSSGLVADDAMVYEGSLFPDPFYATGFPITEAYWVTIPVNGTPSDVLLQCFERRCLTYTPSNEPGWQVEAGNVGRHYLEWRYGDEAPYVTEANIYLVAIGDAGASGELIGCDDSLVPVVREVSVTRGPVVGALEALFAIDTAQLGESGLSNALYTWDVAVDSVEVVDGSATVNLSGDYSIGGICDHPRIQNQLERTVLQFPDVDAVEIYVNGQTLEEILSVQ